jgi:hypothetical protein
VALQKGLDEHWWALEADDITRMQATSERTGWWSPAPGERTHPSWDPEARLGQWLAGYFGCIAALAGTGSNVLAVGGWLETAWLRDLADALAPVEAYCVGVSAPLEELERREAARGDRPAGYARSHHEKALRHAPFDAQIDTAAQSAPTRASPPCADCWPPRPRSRSSRGCGRSARRPRPVPGPGEVYGRAGGWDGRGEKRHMALPKKGTRVVALAPHGLLTGSRPASRTDSHPARLRAATPLSHAREGLTGPGRALVLLARCWPPAPQGTPSLACERGWRPQRAGVRV